MSIGIMETVILVALALLFFGPKRLPGLGKSMGEAIRGFKEGIAGLHEEDQKVIEPKTVKDTENKA